MNQNWKKELRESWLEFNAEMCLTSPEEQEIVADFFLNRFDTLLEEKLSKLLVECEFEKDAKGCRHKIKEVLQILN